MVGQLGSAMGIFSKELPPSPPLTHLHPSLPPPPTWTHPSLPVCISSQALYALGPYRPWLGYAIKNALCYTLRKGNINAFFLVFYLNLLVEVLNFVVKSIFFAEFIKHDHE